MADQAQWRGDEGDDDIDYSPAWWLAVVIALTFGVLLIPLVAAGAWFGLFLMRHWR